MSLTLKVKEYLRKQTKQLPMKIPSKLKIQRIQAEKR